MANLEAVEGAIDSAAGWERVYERYGQTWKWRQEVETPKVIRDHQTWRQRTFWRRLFLTIIGRKVILRVDRCPWVACRDMDYTNKRALEVIADPEGVFK